jgi:hypothetical protein
MDIAHVVCCNPVVAIIGLYVTGMVVTGTLEMVRTFLTTEKDLS